MNRRCTGPLAAAAMAFLAAGIASAPGASGQDPDWPCVQRKVPELSLAQVWTGPELPAAASRWANDKEIAALVAELSARRVPLGEAQDRIRDFASGLPAGQAEVSLLTLVQGLFDHMNAERSEIMSGIQRYARKQRSLAVELRKEGSELDALRARADADPQEIDRRAERLTWDTRVFDERVQSLTYVCEVPTLIEQRLYALAGTVAEAMAGK
jgi:hypothetical protein